jgi:hypothetical protein
LLVQAGRAGMTAEAAAPEADRVWRLPADIRGARAILTVLFLALPGGYLWLTLWTNDVRNAGWIALACVGPAWGWLAWRIWTQRVTLTQDTLVIRNVFQTERVAVVDITAVAFHRGILTVTEARPPSRLIGGVPMTPLDGALGGPGRHAAPGGPGERYKIGALGLGNRYWSGRPCDADDAAGEIAAAAGLPPLPRRKPVIGRRASAAGVPIAIAFIVVGQVMPHTHGGLRDAVFGASLTGIGFTSFWPSIYTAYDHYIRRDSRLRRRNTRPR